ncbi:MAG: Ornithine aminotransferase 2 [Candidatus Aminicenantes bacterium ADurb.Bin508]|nr:MAG: Ornithine aminotransferase 2 [Candidatus Aminicenantes bacterium ADurb.Bin508]
MACAGTEAVLNLLTEEFLERVVRLGHSFREGLSARSPEATVRGKGLMVGVDVGKPRRDHLLKALQREGVLALPAGEGTVRFLPPLTIAREEIQEILDAWSRAWEA